LNSSAQNPTPIKAAPPYSELACRIASALVLAVAAIVTAWVGGIWLALFWAIAGIGVLFEWVRLVWGRGGVPWVVAGLAYASVIVIVPLVMRAEPQWGLAALLWLFAVVWITDIMAFACGRLIGGPKLWPRLSPKKTWSGFVGGVVCGTAASTAVAAYAGAPTLAPVVAIGFVAGVATQLGDLFESALKRQFGVKDTGKIIPGHGGMMDRLDGFAAACAVVFVIGAAHGGFGGVARGLLVW